MDRHEVQNELKPIFFNVHYYELYTDTLEFLFFSSAFKCNIDEQCDDALKLETYYISQHCGSVILRDISMLIPSEKQLRSKEENVN